MKTTGDLTTRITKLESITTELKAINTITATVLTALTRRIEELETIIGTPDIEVTLPPVVEGNIIPAILPAGTLQTLIDTIHITGN